MRNPLVLLLALSALPALAGVPEIWPDKADRVNYGNPVWADLDGDTDLDLLVVDHYQPVELWRNDGQGGFTDVTPSVWVNDDDRHGVAVGDYDRDGDLDVFFSLGGAKGHSLGKKSDQLWRNDGGFRFTEVAAAAGVKNAYGRSRSPRWLDYDRDGDLDLLILNLQTPHVFYENLGNGSFQDVSTSSGINAAGGTLWNATVGDYDGDTWPDLFVNGDGRDMLLRNDRHKHFVDAGISAGIGAKDHSRGAVFADLDNDGDLDLFVARDYFDKKYNLKGDSTRISFSDAILKVERGVDFRTTGRTVTFDLWIENGHYTEGVRIGAGARFAPGFPFTLSSTDPTVIGEPPHQVPDLGFWLWRDTASPDLWHLRWDGNNAVDPRYHFGVITTDGRFTEANPVGFSTYPSPNIPDTLYRNNGNGTFTDVTARAGIGGPGNWNSRGVAAGDVNNDGWLDLYLVNSGDRCLPSKFPNSLWINLRNGTFADKAAQAGVEAVVKGLGEGVGLADMDGNGWLDLWTCMGRDDEVPGQGPHLLFKNPGGSARWVEVRLVGVESSTDAYGAWVTARVGAGRQVRYLGGSGVGGGDFFSQGHPGFVHFGLGTAFQVDLLEIRWPSGQTDRVGPLSANRFYTVREGGIVTAAPAP